MSLPDFLIVGAPKCGTTALHAFLKEHPGLHLPRKEFHHFGRDLRPEGYTGHHWDRARYEGLFEEAEAGQLCGDSSVWYLSSRTAAQEIHERNPEARILILLRNPVDMMYSLYNMFIWVRDLTPNGVIDRESGRVLSFEEALDTQETRKAELERDGDDEAAAGRRVLRLFHTDAAMFSDQVARFFDAFPRAQVHVVLHDDFVAEPEATYRGVLRFLGVAEEFEPTFRKVNASRDFKSVTLHRLMNDHGALLALRRAMRVAVPRSLRKKVFRLIKRANVQTRPQEPMKEATRRRLEAHFRDDVEALGRLLGQDLTARWLSKTAPSETAPSAFPAHG